MGLAVTSAAPILAPTDGSAIVAKESYGLAYNVYAEIYITPIKNLEWYFEVDVNNGGTTADQSAITFASTTGITWYLPAL